VLRLYSPFLARGFVTEAVGDVLAFTTAAPFVHALNQFLATPRNPPELRTAGSQSRPVLTLDSLQPRGGLIAKALRGE
jgi:hypothetical protein